MPPLTRAAAALLLTLLLTACGGGDPEHDDADQPRDTQPVNCKVTPARCL